MNEDNKKVETKEFELDEAAVKTIVKETSGAVMEEVEKSVDEKVKIAVEASSKELLDKNLADKEEIERKAVEAHMEATKGEDPIAKGIEAGAFTEEIAKMSPAMRFYLAARAVNPDTRDTELLLSLNKFALASQIAKRAEIFKEKGFEAVEKTGYANETTAADGQVLIPDAEFVTTVFDNLPAYGVAFQFADVRQTDRTSVRVLSLDSGLTFYSTAEAGVKTSAKLAFAKNEVSLQKYAVIVPATDELTEDAAIDYWNLVTKELTRAYAKKADEVVFTDAAGSASGSGGITNQTGVITHSVGSADGIVTWDDLLDLESKLEDDIDTSSYRWFMRKETWYTLVQTKGTTNDHYIAGSLNMGWSANINTPTTPWGTPVTFTRVLPTVNSVSANDSFAVFGDLKNYLVYNKRGMQLMMLREATILDSEGQSLNLATQDASAMRAVIRLLGILPKGNRGRFGVLGTGTVS